jgi:hypothetical protein
MEAWHTARTRYTRSCAVNSIVGHILGIGDRHTSNILVHTKTGEVVHIDFGIVFEQGKVGYDHFLHRSNTETRPLALTTFTLNSMSCLLDINNARIGAISPDKKCRGWDGTIGY